MSSFTPGSKRHVDAAADYTQELRVGRGDICNWAVRFERLRRKFRIGWITTVAWVLIGAGFGAWIQNGKWNTGAVVAAVAGAALLVGMLFAHEERAENLNNLCDDFLRFVDLWPAMEGHDKNSEYVLGIVEDDTPGEMRRLIGLVKKVRGR